MNADGAPAATKRRGRAQSDRRFHADRRLVAPYERSWLKNDVIAGLSVWALMVPTSLGYACLAACPCRTASTPRRPA